MYEYDYDVFRDPYELCNWLNDHPNYEAVSVVQNGSFGGDGSYVLFYKEKKS